MATKTLANLEQLRLDILSVDDPQMGHDGSIEEETSLVPGPAGRGHHGAGGECRDGLVGLVEVGLDGVVRGHDSAMVGLQSVGARNLVVWGGGSGKLLDMGTHALFVMGLCKLLVLDKLGLKGLFPLRLGVAVGLLDSGLHVCQGGSNGLLVDDMVVGSREVDVGSGVGGIVRFDVRRNGLLDLEVGLANARRRLVAFLERGGAAEEDGEDGVPGDESVKKKKKKQQLGRYANMTKGIIRDSYLATTLNVLAITPGRLRGRCLGVTLGLAEWLRVGLMGPLTPFLE